MCGYVLGTDGLLIELLTTYTHKLTAANCRVLWRRRDTVGSEER